MPAKETLADPIPLLDLKAQYAEIRYEIDAAVAQVVESQRFILGPEVEQFEREVAGYCQCREAVGVSSGTDAILAALMALEVGPGDEVVTTSYTFAATAGGIARLGAKPVFVDIEPTTCNIDVAQIEAVVTDRTKAVLPVHLFGQTAEMDTVMDIAARHRLVVIEDAAQAVGAEYGGRRAGGIGHAGCLSFFPSKNLGAFGDGGMVTTNDLELARRLRMLRNHGFSPKYHSKIIGGNFRLDAIQAAVLRTKLKHLDRWTEARQRNAQTYRRLFGEAGPDAAAGGIVPPYEAPDRRHIYNQFVIRVPAGVRDPLREHLTARNIGSEVYYPVPLHRQEVFAGPCARGDLPHSDRAAAETLALPIYPELTAAQITRVVDAITAFAAP